MSQDLVSSELNEQDWYKNEKSWGDSGYSDTFRALKSQIDYNYNRYKDQLIFLERRRENLTKEKWGTLKMLLLIILTPVIVFLLGRLFTILGAMSGIFGILAIAFLILLPISIVVCEIFMLLPAARNLLNNIYRDNILNLPGKEPIITFVDEKRFLNQKINEIEMFYERIEIEGIDIKGGTFQLGADDEMSEYDQKILDEMRSLSLFKECSATVTEIKREAGYAWLIVGLGIFLGLIVASVAFKL